MGDSQMIERCGYVAIVGRPNVGKSTLMNHLIGQKISITSKKPQTTRNRIIGVKTTGDTQIIYVDTPGVHKGGKKVINRMMNRTAMGSLADVDVIAFVVEAGQWQEEDQVVLENIHTAKAPIILVINKIDKLADKSALLPFIQKVSALLDVHDTIPVSAFKGDNLESLEKSVAACLPQSPAIFEQDDLTDKSMRFLAAEIVREKLMRKLEKELPYSVAVEIEEFKELPHITNIAACIWVERNSQKGIVIGKQGQTLKAIGTHARQDLEKLLDGKVNLKLWVKVKEGWSENERILRSLGIDEN